MGQMVGSDLCANHERSLHVFFQDNLCAEGSFVTVKASRSRRFNSFPQTACNGFNIKQLQNLNF